MLPPDADETSAQLLVRDAGPDDRATALSLLRDAGWTTAQLEAWRSGAPAVVLYDPANDVTYGVAAVSEDGAGTYSLVGWAVRDLADTTAAGGRVVRAGADRARRAGGERLVVTIDDGDPAIHVLIAAGFDVVASLLSQSSGRMTLYLEL